MPLLAELKRRNVLRVGAAYVALGWVVTEASSTIVPLLNLPSWLPSAILWLGIIVFPFVVVIAWVYDFTPDGVVRAGQAPGSGTRSGETGRKLDLVTIAMTTLAVLVVLGREWAPGGDRPAPGDAAAAPEVPVVAVLPFMSTGSDDGGFLASGLHDDLLTRLARLDAFRVISRTSVMEYAEGTRNMRQIGEALGAQFILEGGVQARGQQVRINAQLIDAASDEHLWAETYDRRLQAEDLFAVQAELAAAIAQAMHSALGPRDQALMAEIPTRSTAAYNAYLRGLEWWDEGNFTGDNTRRAVAAFEEAVALDPEFAEAWAQLSIMRSRLVQVSGDPGFAPGARAARDRARELKPDLPATDIASAIYLYRVEREYQAALDILDALAERSTLDARALMQQAWLQRRLGRFREGYETVLKAQRRDPRSKLVADGLINHAVEAGLCEAAAQHVADGLALEPDALYIRANVARYAMYCSGDMQRAARLMADQALDGEETWIWITAMDAAALSGDFAHWLELGRQRQTQAGTFTPVFALLDQAWALKQLQREAQAAGKLQEAGDTLERLEEDPGHASSEAFAMARAAYHAHRQEAQAVHAWIKEHRERARRQRKGDRYLAANDRIFYMINLLEAGDVDAAATIADTMLATPGGAGWPYVRGWFKLYELQDHPAYRKLSRGRAAP